MRQQLLKRDRSLVGRNGCQIRIGRGDSVERWRRRLRGRRNLHRRLRLSRGRQSEDRQRDEEKTGSGAAL